MIRDILKSKQVVIGFTLILFMFAAAIFADIIATHDPYKTDVSDQARLLPPSDAHIFGTDDLGRDVFSRMAYGARISLTVGFIAVAIMVVIGIIMGALAGYYGGIADAAIMQLIELLICIPRLYLILIIIVLFGPSVLNVMLVIGLTSWPGLARLVRAEFLSLRERDFVTAARALGASDARIIFRHILPNAMGIIFVTATLSVGDAILIESGLSFLGLGVQIPTPSWGNILTTGKDYIDYAWWLTVFPGLAILLTVLSFNMVGDGLQGILDPRRRGT